MNNLIHIDLFSGIGGFALAAQWAGFETKVFCEIDPFCQKVLKKHWPDVPIVEDIKKFNGKEWTGATLVTGGFPCQDISTAGKKVGIGGERSSLYKEYLRAISEIRPKFSLMENSAAIIHRGASEIFGSLAEIGFNSEWHCIPVAILGAPHIRDRIWIFSYPNDKGESKVQINDEAQGMQGIYAYSKFGKFPLGWYLARTWRSGELDKKWNPWNNEDSPLGMGMDARIPKRLDRLRALGNAIVPQVAYQIIKAIAEIENANMA